MKMAQFISITLVIILGMFLNTCGQMTYEDEGMGSKSIGEAGTTTDDTTTDDTTTCTSSDSNASFVAVGISGTIVRSTDNGSSFSTVTSPTSNDLWGVGFSE